MTKEAVMMTNKKIIVDVTKKDIIIHTNGDLLIQIFQHTRSNKTNSTEKNLIQSLLRTMVLS